MILLDNLHMKKIIILIFSIIISSACYSQFIDNKINIYFGNGFGMSHGKDYVQQENFIFPSIYNNFQNITNKSIKGIVTKNENISVGLGFDIFTASNWILANNNYFTDSRINQYSISPILKYHNKFVAIGKFNIIKTYAEFNPKIGLSNFQIINPIVEVKTGTEEIKTPITSNNLLLGLKTNVGVEIKITQDLGLYLEYSLNYGYAKSNLFLDKDYLNSQISFGLFLRLQRDKLYYY